MAQRPHTLPKRGSNDIPSCYFLSLSLPTIQATTLSLTDLACVRTHALSTPPLSYSEGERRGNHSDFMQLPSGEGERGSFFRSGRKEGPPGPPPPPFLMELYAAQKWQMGRGGEKEVGGGGGKED